MPSLVSCSLSCFSAVKMVKIVMTVCVDASFFNMTGEINYITKKLESYSFNKPWPRQLF